MLEDQAMQREVSILQQVIDEVEDYLKLLKGIYDFNSLSHLLRRPDFKFTFDGMHGVAGPYAKRIFVKACPLHPSQNICREPCRQVACSMDGFQISCQSSSACFSFPGITHHACMAAGLLLQAAVPYHRHLLSERKSLLRSVLNTH